MAAMGGPEKKMDVTILPVSRSGAAGSSRTGSFRERSVTTDGGALPAAKETAEAAVTLIRLNEPLGTAGSKNRAYRVISAPVIQVSRNCFMAILAAIASLFWEDAGWNLTEGVVDISLINGR